MNKLHILILIFALFFTACSLKPRLVIPEANYTAKDDNTSLSKQWWRGFEDEKLNKLVEQALKNNTDLRIAYINLEKAVAQLGIEFSDLLPKIDATGSGARAKTSKNAPSNQTNNFVYGNDFILGLQMSYELDLWGKYRDSFFAGQAALRASEFDYEASRLSIIASVVQGYFNLANAYENMNILKETLDAYTQTYEIKEIQFEAGSIDEYELEQNRAELQSVRAQYTSAIATKENYLKVLKILIGSDDLDDILYNEQDYTKFAKYSLSLPEGISSEILLQRPDIGAALQTLTQQNYLVGVARTAFLPSISITGLFGFESYDLDLLLKDGSKTWNIGGSFTLPIFRWGEIWQSVNLAKLAKDEAFLNYENILRTAFAEVRLALAQRQTSMQNYENYKTLLSSQEKIYDLASIRYENGNIPLIEYLDARRNLLNARISFASANYDMANAIVEVIKAFGGGFKADDKIGDNIEEDAKNLNFSFRE
ncbi:MULTISPECIES: efflux transporter outer membrane subunit [unclassified Campylobacter]|uniref:efflux transporter outer membrane subunit n=1 Tax=unclassified Campylobacter TaxID=2593542 RepID=UPI00123814C9|nr:MULTISPECIES: TolC family protein [unclassified Campylobacter]KAA6227495.1 TolC family protein [Campylobacter sp. LR196d]KAA6228521.1 TolC family protein [Campylobacter sp. LR286c]